MALEAMQNDVEDRPPWEPGPSIFRLIRDWDGTRPLELPDETPPSSGKVRFASGAFDGILTHHMGAAGEHEEAKVVHGALVAIGRLAATGGERARRDLYRLFLEQPVVSYTDALVAELVRQNEFELRAMREHARWLLHAATHREPLKLGIVLLGLAGTPDDVDDLVAVSRHDEFTLFAAVAVANLRDDPADAWWAMARTVHGWGKVHVVERLCGRVDDRPDIRGWLIRHGCDNAVMPEYLAACCARAGRLAEALRDEEPDDACLDGACLILRALLNCGPAEDIDSYEDGADAASALVGHLAVRCRSLDRLDLVATLLDWLEVPDGDGSSRASADRGGRFDPWEGRHALGWTVAVRTELAARCREILGRAEWRERVVAGYSSGDAYRRSLAWSLAPRVGVDLWEAGYTRLASDPLDSHLYWNLIQTKDGARARRVVAFAEANLPLDEVASGPASELGLGPAYRAHGCLDFLVQEMRRDGVWSARLVAAALRSPVVRNRFMAVAALEHHVPEEWGPGLAAALRRAVADEPEDSLRGRMEAVAARVWPGR